MCQGCPHRSVFSALHNLDCIVASDIGCYTLAVMPPFEATDTCVCMGASIGVGLGLRHALPPEQARRVVSTIGDSTFIHSGITGLVEMVYNPPTNRPRGHYSRQRHHGDDGDCRSIREPAGPSNTSPPAKSSLKIWCARSEFPACT